MQILVAWAVSEPADFLLASATSRVEGVNAGRWSTPPTPWAVTGQRAGLALWGGGEFSAWPEWVQRGGTAVASLYAPVGYERVVAAEPLDTAPLRLAAELERSPGSMQELCPPFVLAQLDEDADRLTLRTDAVGIGRLFEVRTAWGWVWSNRPESALAFAGLPYRPDEVGWDHMGVADEMFGHVTPYAGVRTIDAGTTITWDGQGRHVSSVSADPVVSWASGGPQGKVSDLLDGAADALSSVATSIGRLFPETPTVALTGGRDSRLVASAFLASGTDVRLMTHDALPEDLHVARELVSRLSEAPEHEVHHVPTGNVAAAAPWEALASASGWHQYAEGLRPYSYLHHRAPQYIDLARPVAIGGAGGEVAHGFFYLAGRTELEALPQEQMISRFADGVLRRYSAVDGARPAARALVREQIHTALLDIAARGYEDSTILDIYYLRQRMRRWGSTGERPGTLSPLLAPGFIRACIGLTPAQRQQNLLHRELTRRLAPQWADVPYYPAEYTTSAGGRTTVAPRVIRVGDAADRDAVHSVIHEQAWTSAFDPAVVARLWEDSVTGQTNARAERVLRAVVWRAAFEDRLAVLNGSSAGPRPVVPWVAPPAEEIAVPIEVAATDRSVPSPAPAKPAPVTSPPAMPRSPLSQVARKAARSRVWVQTRDTTAGRLLRQGARAARRRGLSL